MEEDFLCRAQGFSFFMPPLLERGMMPVDNTPMITSSAIVKRKTGWCGRPLDTLTSVGQALETIPLTDIQRSILQLRYISLLREYKTRSVRYSYYFNGLRIIISVGSLIVPALLSVQYTPGTSSATGGISEMTVQMYWIVWVLSLTVTISNAVIALLKVDKKYYTLNTTYQQLLSEGWQFIELSGKYSGFYTPNMNSTHTNQFIYFCNVLEKIRMRHVQDEYYKVDDHPHTAANGAKAEQLIPPTPLKPMPSLPFEAVVDVDEKSDILVNGGREEGQGQGTTVRKQNAPASTAVQEQARDQSKVYESP